jgi:hypothetical protein
MVHFFSTCRDAIRTIPALQHDQARPEDVDTEGEDHEAKLSQHRRNTAIAASRSGASPLCWCGAPLALVKLDRPHPRRALRMRGIAPEDPPDRLTPLHQHGRCSRRGSPSRTSRIGCAVGSAAASRPRPSPEPLGSPLIRPRGLRGALEACPEKQDPDNRGMPGSDRGWLRKCWLRRASATP